MNESQSIKDGIIAWGNQQGVDLIGFANANTWDEFKDVPENYRPKSIWPMTKTVIVLGLQMPLPMVETTPSAVHMELYNTSNRELDRLAYGLTRYPIGRVLLRFSSREMLMVISES